jgi:aryl-alcohol dehydrogenase-like predicted oxidoreductase
MTGISTVTVGWSPLGGGLLTGKYRRGEMGRAESFKRLVHAESDAVKSAVLDVVLAVAEEAGGSPAVVALAWVLKRGVLPILGPRTADQLKDNLAVAKFARLRSRSRGSMPPARSRSASHTTCWRQTVSARGWPEDCPIGSKLQLFQ